MRVDEVRVEDRNSTAEGDGLEKRRGCRIRREHRKGEGTEEIVAEDRELAEGGEKGDGEGGKQGIKWGRRVKERRCIEALGVPEKAPSSQPSG